MAIKSLIKRNYEKQPKSNYPDYKSSILRAPKKDKFFFPSSPSEISGPIFNKNIIGKLDNDLTLNFSHNNGTPLGHKIIVHGTIRDQFLKPINGALIEIWQANAGGKYLHKSDQNIAAIDPNFAGCGRYITEGNGAYQFITIQPGPYPYLNRSVEWRPMHIHFSIFGQSFGQRLITQMYFEGDPLIKFCPMVNSIPDAKAKKSLIGLLDRTKSNIKKLLAYKFDIILRGSTQTYFENRKEGL
ncbi:protocatechuate 3,4-dioxygenase subunit beta [Alphaproteobacteria bacterium]|nr:protocatechuate 3,4-dioxygenase subunit beta [Alphaproteobacteria bacterium]